MARYTAEEALCMLEEFDSGGELDIEEDPLFPLPLDEDEHFGESPSHPDFPYITPSPPSTIPSHPISPVPSDPGRSQSHSPQWLW